MALSRREGFKDRVLSLTPDSCRLVSGPRASQLKRLEVKLHLPPSTTFIKAQADPLLSPAAFAISIQLSIEDLVCSSWTALLPSGSRRDSDLLPGGVDTADAACHCV